MLEHNNSVWLEIARNAMACRFEVLLHPGKPNNGPEIAFSALDTITFLDQLLSVYIPTSELSLVNEQAFEAPVKVSESTFALLELGLSVYERTGGAFDMTAAKLSKTWGFYRRQGKMPTDLEIRQSLTEVGSKHICLDASDRTVRFNKKLEVNPGGIGKGFAIDCGASLLKAEGIEDFVSKPSPSQFGTRPMATNTRSKVSSTVAPFASIAATIPSVVAVSLVILVLSFTSLKFFLANNITGRTKSWSAPATQNSSASTSVTLLPSAA